MIWLSKLNERKDKKGSAITEVIGSYWCCVILGYTWAISKAIKRRLFQLLELFSKAICGLVFSSDSCICFIPFASSENFCIIAGGQGYTYWIWKISGIFTQNFKVQGTQWSRHPVSVISKIKWEFQHNPYNRGHGATVYSRCLFCRNFLCTFFYFSRRDKIKADGNKNNTHEFRSICF